MRKNLFILFAFNLLFVSCNQKDTKDKEVIDYATRLGLPIKDKDVKNIDPAILFAYSCSLFNQNKKDEATFWYYVGQYRARLYLGTMTYEDYMDSNIVRKVFKECDMFQIEDITIGGFSHKVAYELIMEKAGAKINGYAFGDVDHLQGIVDNVIAYEKNNPCNLEGFAPKTSLADEDKRKEENKGVMDGLIKLKDILKKEKENIKAKRTKNGLENRN